MTAKVSEAPAVLLTAAAFVIVVAGLQAASAIVIPFLLALFIATLCAPPLFWLVRQGVPNALAVFIILLALVILAVLMIVFLSRSLTALTQQLPSYQERLLVLHNQVVAWLNSYGLQIETDNVILADYFSPRFLMTLVSYGLSILRVLVTNLFIILLCVLFILLEAATFQAKMQNAFPDPQVWEQAKIAAAHINCSMSYKTLISLVTGLLIWISLAVIGVDFAGTWGVLASPLNFIPSIGSILAAVPAIVWALVQLGLLSALLTLLAYLIVNIAIGNFLDPRLLGHKLGLSTLVVIISLIFWGWVFGPIGMLLSVPLTMIAKIVFASRERTRWLAVLLE
ncbi:MAG: AI-2E family transporter [Desulfobacca sp.]|uniref:AI-2E family transporter n=1 Tax=Desulfobacca sp. TaxID=2067990 RepID=UPI00404ABA8B